MNEWTEAEINQVSKQIKEKASKDQDFRAKALADPAWAFEEVGGKKIPEGLKINVVQPGEGGELSDSDLEQVAGGARNCLLDFTTGCFVALWPNEEGEHALCVIDW